jgi:hypothetical protein
VVFLATLRVAVALGFAADLALEDAAERVVRFDSVAASSVSAGSAVESVRSSASAAVRASAFERVLRLRLGESPAARFRLVAAR